MWVIFPPPIKRSNNTHCERLCVYIYVERTAIHCCAHCYALPHTAAHSRTHCRTRPHCHTRTAALPYTHCRTATHTLPHITTHCRTANYELPHYRTLPSALLQTAALPDSCTLPCELPYTTKNTAPHYRVHCAHTNMRTATYCPSRRSHCHCRTAATTAQVVVLFI
jgi:hypothetical protein